ncbi:UNVERIFIED_CONTAM: hypothetical protein FKN15_025796 [Acipenser sinensis]
MEIVQEQGELIRCGGGLGAKNRGTEAEEHQGKEGIDAGASVHRKTQSTEALRLCSTEGVEAPMHRGSETPMHCGHRCRERLSTEAPRFWSTESAKGAEHRAPRAPKYRCSEAPRHQGC